MAQRFAVIRRDSSLVCTGCQCAQRTSIPPCGCPEKLLPPSSSPQHAVSAAGNCISVGSRNARHKHTAATAAAAGILVCDGYRIMIVLNSSRKSASTSIWHLFSTAVYIYYIYDRAIYEKMRTVDYAYCTASIF